MSTARAPSHGDCAADCVAEALVLVMSRGVSLADWHDAGVLQREWALYEAIGSAYSQIVVVSSGGWRDLEIAATLTPRPTIVCNTEKTSLERFAARTPDWVAQALAGTATAVVKTNQMDAGELAAAITRSLRSAGVRTGLVARGGYLWSRFVAAEAGADDPRAAEAGAVERSLCGAADIVVGTTHAMVDDLAWRYGLGTARMRVVANYVLNPPTPSERADDEILCAGTLCGRKRVDLLIEAVAKLAESSRPRLAIVGAGGQRAALEALARARSVDATFLGRIAHRDLLDRMARCTIFAHASALEGHPKTILEAMACGAPVVACEAPGTRQVIDCDRTGVLVVGDAASIAGALGQLLGDPARRDRLGQSARAWARDQLSIQVIVPQELEAHAAALDRAADGVAHASGAVRWDTDLLEAAPQAQAAAFGRSIAGLARRLDPPDRVRFLLGLDEPIYQQQGLAAVAASAVDLGGDGLHPKHRIMRYHDFFTDRITGGQRVIDLGCGVGALAVSIAQRCGARVVGMDLSQAALDQARQRVDETATDDRVRLIRGDITADRAPGTFDVLVLSNVLEHLRDRPALLARYRHWYRPGRFLIRVPALDRAWQVLYKRELGVEWRLDDTHELEYTRAVLRAELAEAGLRIDELNACWGEYWLCARPTETRKEAAHA